MSEDDEKAGDRAGVHPPTRSEDNSLGRLFALSDGVFAIAMTLLALDLKVPELDGHVTDHALRQALSDNAASYWTFLLSFYVVGVYWLRHRRLMKSVIVSHPALIRDTFPVLLLVAAMPFPASLLGRYGSTPFALALYAAVNAAATAFLIALSRDVHRYELADPNADGDELYGYRWQSWYNLIIFLICIPGAYVLGRHGPWLLTLIVVPGLVAALRKFPFAGRFRTSVD